jgi:Na+/H+-translocating membrane pyrophosphatase
MLYSFASLIYFLALIMVVFAMLYQYTPQRLDRLLKICGYSPGIRGITGSFLLRWLANLAKLLALIAAIIAYLVYFHGWPSGWLIPAIQSAVLAGLLYGFISWNK